MASDTLMASDTAERGEKFAPDYLPSLPYAETLAPRPSEPPVAKPRWWLAAFLFVATFLLCTAMGVFWSYAMRTDVVTGLFPAGPVLDWTTFQKIWSDPRLLLFGLSFSVPALAILTCHELGHYLACRKYRVPATLPYFLPLPAVFGTLGAFIKIKAPIRHKRQLFDIGIAGPLAGFAVLLPLLLIGVAKSSPTPVPALATAGEPYTILLVPGQCLALRLAAWLFHGTLPEGWMLNLHPFAIAAWFGMLVTSLNLLPLGQLDGGHILYATAGKSQHRLAIPLWIVLAALSFFWPGWALWAVITLVLGLRHPPVVDEDEPLDARRKGLAVAALAVFVLCFVPRPLAEWQLDAGPETDLFSLALQPSEGGSSKTKVTGPSLTSSTSIWAPKRPLATSKPNPRSSSIKPSTNWAATGGGAAPSKEGRRPRFRDPARVN